MNDPKNSQETKFYHPFDPLPEGMNENEARYRLVPTSKMHVRKVCDVMAKRTSVPDQVRCKYADQAGYALEARSEKREGDETKTIKEFTLFDVFSEYHVHAALAAALFQGFPKLIEVNEEHEVEVIEPALFDRLDEGVVNEAFFSFNAARSGTQSALTGLSNSLNHALNHPKQVAAQNNSRLSSTTG